MATIRWSLGVAVVWAAGALAGCASPETARSMAQSSDPVVRAKGCKLAGDDRQTAMVPLLVDRLEDPDSAVRFFAIEALRRITGTDLDYREADTPAAKAKTIARWRQYVAKGNGGPR